MNVSSCVNVQDKIGGAYTIGFKIPSLKLSSCGVKSSLSKQSNKVQVIYKESFLNGFLAVLSTSAVVVACECAAKALGVSVLTMGGPYVWVVVSIVLVVIFVVASFFYVSYTPSSLAQKKL